MFRFRLSVTARPRVVLYLSKTYSRIENSIKNNFTNKKIDFHTHGHGPVMEYKTWWRILYVWYQNQNYLFIIQANACVTVSTTIRSRKKLAQTLTVLNPSCWWWSVKKKRKRNWLTEQQRRQKCILNTKINYNNIIMVDWMLFITVFELQHLPFGRPWSLKL